MTAETLDLWERALRALQTARQLTQTDPDASASRSYFAIFYAVSAFFTLSGQSFAKHSGVEAAVHRDLVRPGRWSADLGANYSWLSRLRKTGDYGGESHVSSAEAMEAVSKAEQLLEAVRKISTEPLTPIPP